MRKYFVIQTAVLLALGLYPFNSRSNAQVPEKISYQAVVRSSSNQLVTNQFVGMQVSILQDSINGLPIYIENHRPTTNANGLLSIEIGGEAGFNTINWGEGSYFIKIEIDPTGGTNYTITGTSQLLSVPFALHAKTAQSVLSGVEVINSNYQIYSGNAVTQWTDLDLSSAIGKNSAILFLKVTNNDLTNPARFIFKEKGDNSIYQLLNDPGLMFTSLNGGSSGQVIVRSNEDGIIEWCSNNSFNCTIELITYIK